MHRLFPALWFACIAAAAIPAWADSSVERPRADPGDATAPVPQVVYRSPFEGYRALGDDNLMPWKETNDTVGRIGGWRAYAKEAQAPEPTGNAISPGTRKPATANSAAPTPDHPVGADTK